MATLVGTFFHSHGGTTDVPGELFREMRLVRPVREDVPMPPFHPNATVPLPAPTAPSSTAPAFAPAIAAIT